VCRSTDSGTTWMPSNIGLTNTEVLCLPVESSSIIAETNGSAFLSNDTGSSWIATTAGVPSFQFNSFAASRGDLFASASGQGVFRSTDSGASWGQMGNGSGYSSLSSVYSLAANESYLFAGTPNGVWSSIDNGNNWTGGGGLPIYGLYVSSLAIMNDNIFAGTDGYGVYISTDNGVGWSEITNGAFSLYTFNSLAASGTNLVTGTNGGGIFLSTDSGVSWTAVNTGLTDSNILSLAIIDSNLFAGTSTAGVWRRPLSEILPSPYKIAAVPDSLSFGNVRVGTSSTLYVSLRNTGSADLNIASIGVQGSGTIFMSGVVSLPRTLLQGNALMIGVTFKPANGGLKQDTLMISSESKQLRIPLSGTGIENIYQLSANADALSFGDVIVGKDSTLPLSLINTGNMAITLTSAALRSAGTSFTTSVNLPATLQPGDSSRFSVTFSPSMLGSQVDTLVALSEAKQLDIPLSGTGIAGAGVSTATLSAAPLQCYPNPCSQSATITYSCAESGLGEVTIVNLLGAEVASLFSGELSDGEHSFIWDSKDAAPGMYECIVRVNGNVQRITMMHLSEP
jgi:photosystem II stability/assembly factor-like uncharacterized protein